MDRSVANLQDGINYVQVADGALNEVHSILQRINELAVQSANDTNTPFDREVIDLEVQELKKEMDNIFTTTEFNNIKIWPKESITNAPFVSGTTQVQSVKITTTSYQSLNISNENYDKIASGSYKINANQQGISISWTDFAGRSHATTPISWDDLETNNYSFNVANYFDPADTTVFDSNGNPAFDFNISFTVTEKATIDHMIAALNDTNMTLYTYGYSTSRFEDSSNSPVSTPDVSSSISTNYPVLYASKANADSSKGEVGFDFDQGVDAFIEASPVTADGGNMVSGPSTTDVTTANNNTENWTFKFYMEGIGELTATSNKVSYNSNERSADTEGLWWHYYTYKDGTKTKLTNTYSSSQKGAGTLGSVMDCLTGDKDSGTPGLLSSEGLSTVGGTIEISFDLKSTSTYSYGNNKTSNSVGTLYLSIKVTNTDTEQTVLNKINNALNDSTIWDIYTTSSSSKCSASVYRSSAKQSMAPEDVYSDSLSYGPVDLTIQSGANAYDSIPINYQCLRVGALNLENTNLLTGESSGNAITEVSNALAIVSEQRSLFGAYQNRMEHAIAINENVSENTTAAESRIRDADMAEAMVEHSKENILMQAAQSMLSQANSNPQRILALLEV